MCTENKEFLELDRANEIERLKRRLANETARADYLEDKLQQQKEAYEKDMSETLCAIGVFCCLAIVIGAFIQHVWWLSIAPTILLIFCGKKGGMWK